MWDHGVQGGRGWRGVASRELPRHKGDLENRRGRMRRRKRCGADVAAQRMAG